MFAVVAGAELEMGRAFRVGFDVCSCGWSRVRNGPGFSGRVRVWAGAELEMGRAFRVGFRFGLEQS